MVSHEQVIQLIRMKGPIIPAQIHKEIKQDLMMTSAILSELSSKSKVKVSHVKIGGSPLYYLEGQEHRLQNFASKLNDKEKKAYDLLREKKILRDIELEPVERVALRQLKDFAVPLQVSYNSVKEIFWKWYLTPGAEAEVLVKTQLGIIRSEMPTPQREEMPAKPIPAKPELQKPIPLAVPKPIPKPVLKPLPRPLAKPEIATPPQPADKPAMAKPTARVLPEKPMQKQAKQPEIPEALQQTLQVELPQTEFMSQLKQFFDKNKIVVKEFELIRKDAEADLILEVPSVVGNIEYYCKAKSKKKFTEGDISTAYVQAQAKKLPLLLLVKGDISAKTMEKIGKAYKGMTVKKI